MFEQIRSNQRRSVFVLAGMFLLLVMTGAALGIVLLPRPDAFAEDTSYLPQMALGAVGGLLLWAILWLFSYWQGDAVLLRMAGARKIEKADHAMLFNVVEEMTIASQLGRLPSVYIVEDPSPNAFATGRRQKNASVAVTTGLLSMLTRDELQGVVAHEIAHIKNRDVALMTTAGIMVGSIVVLADMGRRALWYGMLGGGGRRRSRDSGGGHPIVFVAAIVFVVLAPFLAQLLYLALSRRREYLADASAAVFTRYPPGLAMALQKISGTEVELANQSSVTAPMYISAPVRSWLSKASNWFSTHPPIETRIQVLQSMSGAGYKNYESSYRSVTRRHVIGEQTLGAAQPIGLRGPDDGAHGLDARELQQQTRQASNAYLSAAGYQRISCSNCGATLKIPPSMMKRMKACPRCQAPLPV